MSTALECKNFTDAVIKDVLYDLQKGLINTDKYMERVLNFLNRFEDPNGVAHSTTKEVISSLRFLIHKWVSDNQPDNETRKVFTTIFWNQRW